jgi:hypothetical protein
LDLASLGLLAGSLLLLFGRGWGVLPLIGGAALLGLIRVALAEMAG